MEADPLSKGLLREVFLNRPRGALIQEQISLQVLDSGWEVRTGFWGDYYVMRLHDKERWALGFLYTSLFKTGIVKRLDDGAVVRLSEFVVTNYKWGKLCLFIVKMDLVGVQPILVPPERILPLSELTGENTKYPIDPPLRLPFVPYLYGNRSLNNPKPPPTQPEPLNFKKALQKDPSAPSKEDEVPKEEPMCSGEKYSEIWSFDDYEFKMAFGEPDTPGKNAARAEDPQSRESSSSDAQPQVTKPRYDFDFFPVPYDLVGQFFHIPEPSVPAGPTVTGFPPPSNFPESGSQQQGRSLPGDETLHSSGRGTGGYLYPLINETLCRVPPPPPDLPLQRTNSRTDNCKGRGTGQGYGMGMTHWPGRGCSRPSVLGPLYCRHGYKQKRFCKDNERIGPPDDLAETHRTVHQQQDCTPRAACLTPRAYATTGNKENSSTVAWIRSPVPSYQPPPPGIPPPFHTMCNPAPSPQSSVLIPQSPASSIYHQFARTQQYGGRGCSFRHRGSYQTFQAMHDREHGYMPTQYTMGRRDTSRSRYNNSYIRHSGFRNDNRSRGWTWNRRFY